VLEYCNGGDLGAAIKQRKKFNEEEAVEYLVQILHGFQTLVKNKIMHRDFKLPNVLKNDGVIKIADFGFAKLLGTEDQQVETILGSPLNMAPEVLNHQTYNIKADIWSIGVAFY
jgi:serine/threonine-protein kinase ULK2